MIFKKINIYFLLLMFIIVSCWKDDEKKEAPANNHVKTSVKVVKKVLASEQKVSDYVSFVWWDFTNLEDNFWDIVSSWSLKDLNKSIINEDFKRTQEIIDNIIVEVDKKENLTKQDKIKVQALKYTKVMSILNEWNYFYTEKQKSVEATKLIENILLEYPYSVDNFLSNYYLWYSKEIVKDFTWALDNYNTWLEKISVIDKDNMLKSILTNQIWHVYDLKWNKEESYKYYVKAYNYYNKNYRSSLNIARYLTRIWNYNGAKKFYEYSLATTSNSLKSEIYFSLSSLELELKWLTPDINKSIEYSKKSIKFNKNYPMWYLALARWYYMLNDIKNYKSIEDNLDISIKLNPNWNEAYRYYALHYLDRKDLTRALFYLEKSQDAVDKDMILMEDQRTSFKYLNDLLKVYISISINKLDSINELYTNDKLKYFITTQLKRKNNWIYSSLSSDKSFENIVNFYK